MKDMGFAHSVVQCRAKIKKLKYEYHTVITNNNKSGRGRKTMKHFDKLDSILGERPATCPKHLYESSFSEEPTEININWSTEDDVNEQLEFVGDLEEGKSTKVFF